MIFLENGIFTEEEEIWKKVGAIMSPTFFDDRLLTKFEPTIARGCISFNFSVGQAFRFKKWPNLMWPFNTNWNIYDYNFLEQFSNILNPDIITLIPDFDGPFKTPPSMGLTMGRGILATDILKHDTWPLWIRSVSGTKSFAGGVFTKEQFLVEYEYLKQNNLESINFVMAPVKTIYEEFRLIFVNGEFVDFSPYNAKDPEILIKKEPSIPKILSNFSHKWHSQYGHNWNGTYVLDIAYTNKGLKVVEVNNLLTSGWYQCDIEKIVNSIIKVTSNL